MNMDNELSEQLGRRQRAAWAAFRPLTEGTNQVGESSLCAHLFDTTVLPRLYYAAETWADNSAATKKLRTIHRALERCLLRINRRTQHQAGLCSSDLRRISRLQDSVEYVSKNKQIGWSYYEKRIRQVDKKNNSVDPERNKATARETT